MRIKLLQSVGDDQKGAVLEVDERRAARLLRTGYAVEAPAPAAPRKDKRE